MLPNPQKISVSSVRLLPGWAVAKCPFCSRLFCGYKKAAHLLPKCAVFLICVRKLKYQTNLILRAANATILKRSKPCFQREMLVVP